MPQCGNIFYYMILQISIGYLSLEMLFLEDQHERGERE
jgi:hypothetical protein